MVDNQEVPVNLSAAAPWPSNRYIVPTPHPHLQEDGALHPTRGSPATGQSQPPTPEGPYPHPPEGRWCAPSRRCAAPIRQSPLMQSCTPTYLQEDGALSPEGAQPRHAAEEGEAQQRDGRAGEHSGDGEAEALQYIKVVVERESTPVMDRLKPCRTWVAYLIKELARPHAWLSKTKRPV